MKERESPVSPSPSGGLRLFLYVTAGVTGAAIMIVEILGAKMLAPYFGISHFVWTAQIAVTLVALAAGYYAGGRLVGGLATLGRLYSAIVIAAAYLAVAVALRGWVAYLFLMLPLAAGSLLASVLLFFAPLSLLAMTGPFLVRVVPGSVKEVGRKIVGVFIRQRRRAGWNPGVRLCAWGAVSSAGRSARPANRRNWVGRPRCAAILLCNAPQLICRPARSAGICPAGSSGGEVDQFSAEVSKSGGARPVLMR